MEIKAPKGFIVDVTPDSRTGNYNLDVKFDYKMTTMLDAQFAQDPDVWEFIVGEMAKSLIDYAIKDLKAGGHIT